MEELKEMSKQQHFRPSDELFTFKIIKSVREVIEVMIEGYLNMSVGASTEKEWLLCVVPPITLVLSSLYGIIEDSKKLIESGSGVGIITDISYPYIELAQQHLNIGIVMRHYDQYQGIMYVVFDRKSSMSAISANINRVLLNEPIIALWTNDSTYAIISFPLTNGCGSRQYLQNSG